MFLKKTKNVTLSEQHYWLGFLANLQAWLFEMNAHALKEMHVPQKHVPQKPLLPSYSQRHQTLGAMYLAEHSRHFTLLSDTLHTCS